MPTQTPVSKIKLIDGTIVDLSRIVQLNISDNMLDKLNVTWNLQNSTGSTTPIIGTEDDYLLLLNEVSDLYPIGSLYATESSSVNPATILGFGTWAKYAPMDLTWNDTDLDWNNIVGVTSGIYVWKRTA